MGKNQNKSNKKGNKSQFNTKAKFPVIKSRKDKRKQDRVLKKQNKLQFYEKKYHREKLKESNISDIENDGNKNANVQKIMSEKELVENRKRKKIESEEKLKNAKRKKELQRANIEEDKNIKRLEKQLKLNKRKGKDKEIRLPNSFAEEGLDYILDVCDPSKIENLDMSESDDDDSSKQEDYESDNADEIELQNDEENIMPEGEDEDSIIEDDMNLEMKDEEMNSETNELEESDIENDNEDSNQDDDNSDTQSIASNKNDKESDYWEDIYGRTRDVQGNVVTVQPDAKENSTQSNDVITNSNKYIPPAMRAKMEASNEKLIKLKKQIKGLLNRLAESNMHSVCRQLEDLYSCNSRNDMNECLSEIITSSILTSSGTLATPERLVMEHAVMIGILHANVGNEVGASIIQTTVTQFHKKIGDIDVCENRYLENHAMFLCQLYAFRVTTNSLIFHILNKLADIFNTKAIELIVIILRSIGFLLRKDNPEKLKTLIINIQSKSATKQDKEQDSRIKFMLDILLAIKNNNVKKIPNYDSTYQSHWQKIIKEFLRPGITQITPFEIGYEELLDAESRGKWWIVGSAWSGTTPSQNQNQAQENPKAGDVKFNAELLSLARKMRMNTDTRKNIFCTLMSAEDFLEATERLIKMSVTTQQKEREIIFVILTCCLKEKLKFNPYYAQLASKLSNIDRKYRMACQYAIWDRIREIENLEKYQINNLALFSSKLIIDKVLSLACLKVIEFSDINKTLAKYLRTCILDIFQSSEVIKKEVFLAIAGYPKLSQLRDGLRLFMRHFILKENSKKCVSISEELKASVTQAEHNLLAGDKKFML